MVRVPLNYDEIELSWNIVCILAARRGERIGGAGQEPERRHPDVAGVGRGHQAQVGPAHEHPRARLQRNHE